MAHDQRQLLELLVTQVVRAAEVAHLHHIGFQELIRPACHTHSQLTEPDRPVLDGGEGVGEEALSAQFQIDFASADQSLRYAMWTFASEVAEKVRPMAMARADDLKRL